MKKVSHSIRNLYFGVPSHFIIVTRSRPDYWKVTVNIGLVTLWLPIVWILVNWVFLSPITRRLLSTSSPVHRVESTPKNIELWYWGSAVICSDSNSLGYKAPLQTLRWCPQLPTPHCLFLDMHTWGHNRWMYWRAILWNILELLMCVWATSILDDNILGWK